MASHGNKGLGETRHLGGGLRLLAAAVLAATLATSSAAFAQVVVFVNGEPITNYDIEQRSRFTHVSSQRSPSRKETLDELIDEKIKLQEALRYSMQIPKSEVESRVGSMAGRMGMNVEQFTHALAAKGINIETIRSRIRSEFAWGTLVRARYPATLAIEDKEIRERAEKQGGGADAVAYDYRLREILFIIPKGSPQSVIEGRMREAENLRGRFENCEDGVRLARGLRDVAVRDPIRRSSSDLPENLRNVLNNTAVGKLTKPENSASGQGISTFALCEKRENTTDTPQRRAAQREIFATRYDAISNKYLKELRRSAIIEYK